ncbi:MAG: hypothetical protein HRT89_10905 [Lentisphaeria bacterium]|nr:hypothetical protein [Lentisphaeria bacterium]
MKKTIKLIHPKRKYPRMIEAAKSEIRKYIKRSRRQKLPDGQDYWDFDCTFGATEAEANKVHLTEIDKCINETEAAERESFFISIIPRAAKRNS